MRDNSNDRTVERNYIQKWRFLIREYELVKAKKHTRFRFVQDFYNFHGTNRQTFAKYYNRYRQTGADEALLPLKRGPKWKSRRTLPFIGLTKEMQTTKRRIIKTRAGELGHLDSHHLSRDLVTTWLAEPTFPTGRTSVIPSKGDLGNRRSREGETWETVVPAKGGLCTTVVPAKAGIHPGKFQLRHLGAFRHTTHPNQVADSGGAHARPQCYCVRAR